MENVLGVIGAICGVAGLIISVIVVRWQAKTDARVRAEEAKAHAEELARERANSERLNRLAFLSDRIFDLSIPRELRLPFYEEYISMKGNGTAVRFWLMEETKERAAISK